MQEPRHGEPGPSHHFERLRIRDLFGDVRGVLKFSFDDVSLVLPNAILAGADVPVTPLP
jgi:hypothetical protein